MVTLYIDKSESMCGGCGKGCDPYEESHITLLGWHAVNDKMKGCGAVYTELDSHYNMIGLIESIRDIRPDLPWIGS